jgi:putative ABC transport system permease protein
VPNTCSLYFSDTVVVARSHAADEELPRCFRSQVGGKALGNPNGSSSWTARQCITSPPIQEISPLPSGPSAPKTVITQHATTALRLQSSITTAGWLIQASADLTTAQITSAQQLAAGANGMSIETRSNIPSLAQILDTATIFGIVLALGIVAVSVVLVRSDIIEATRRACRSMDRPFTILGLT